MKVIMKKLYPILIAIIIVASTASVFAQPKDFLTPDRKKNILDSLSTIDPKIVGYFPRWKVCEPDIAAQIYQVFVYRGYPESELNKQDVEVLAAPRESEFVSFEILSISCGRASMNSVEIESFVPDMLVGFISGDYIYTGLNRGIRADNPRRDYCFSDVPPEAPVSTNQAAIILDYLTPTNVTHAFTLSLFEQSLKIGESGFWIRSIIGTDEEGYPFWNAGESKIVLQRPLYVNTDQETNSGIPYLVNAYLGGGYRITSGISNNSGLLSWVSDRKLNAANGGKLIGGFDFYMPFHPYAGVHFNVELPIQSLKKFEADESTYGLLPANNVDFNAENSNYGSGIRIQSVAPVLRATGQFTLFYNWWLDKQNPENYLRFDLGVNYFEVKELAQYFQKVDSTSPQNAGRIASFFDNKGIDGLNNYSPEEFGDWLFLKVEYRNQAVFPFGLSFQYSNQIFLGRIYLPLLSDWLYLEAKYATPLREARPYEIRDFFMLSPVIRLTI